MSKTLVSADEACDRAEALREWLEFNCFPMVRRGVLISSLLRRGISAHAQREGLHQRLSVADLAERLA